MKKRPSLPEPRVTTSPSTLHRALAFALALSTASLGVTPRALAADSVEDQKRKAANFFDAGAEAYKAGQYLAAAEAFEKAYALLPSPSLLFSAAQSYRRQYLAEPKADTLRRAIDLYRTYLKSDAQANRREDAMEALAVLVPLQVRIPTEPGQDGADPDSAASSGTAQDPKKTARILISSNAPGAEVSLDGGPFSPAPLVASVEPGPHRARVRAAGHHDEEVEVQARAHEQVPQHVALRPRPGSLKVSGTAGARVTVDGKLLGSLPSTAPILVDPGSRFVAITATGHEPWTERIEVGKGESKSVYADLKWTTQRRVAWATFSVGGAAAITAGVLAGLSLDRQSQALSLSDKLSTGSLTPTERDGYNSAVQSRNELGQAAAITGIVAAVIVATGIGLYTLDEPAVVAPDSPAGPDKPEKKPFEVAITPGGVGLRF
ncbi:MAG: PEGA domain-containing protein [Polyangiaceae bacterium]